MRLLLAILLLAGGALALPGCAGSVDAGYGYGYETRPGLYDGYYQHNRPYRAFEPYQYRQQPHRVVRREERRAPIHGEVHVRD